MARRIVRRRRVSHPAPVRPVDNVRPQPNLPEAKPMPAARVVIAAPGPLRTVLTSRISSSQAVKLAGIAETEILTIEKVITEEADVAAIDIHLGGELAGLDIARNVSRTCPEVGVLVLVSALDGVDVRRHARSFGVSWSYAMAKNAEAGHHFNEIVECVARGIHWIDPELKRFLEAVWKVASDGRDMEIGDAVKQIEKPTAAPAPSTGGIQSTQVGNGGVGSGFNKSTTGELELDLSIDEDDLDEEDDGPVPPARGIQTIQTGNSGIGSGYNTSKAS